MGERMYGYDLVSAILERDEKKAKMLIEKGADMAFPERGDMAIHLAARYGLLRVIRYLLRGGDDVNRPNENNNTALHYASRDGNEDMVKYLINHGADINRQNKDGNTALHFCVGVQPMDVIERFVHLGMDVNVPNNNGDTPLHVAVSYSREESVEALLMCDADASITNYFNKRPDQLAKVPSIGELIRTFKLLAKFKDSGFIRSLGTKISHTDVEKPKLIDRVDVTLEEIDLPTDFPTTFYCRREFSENTTVTFKKDTDQEIVSDVFIFRVRDVYRDLKTKLSLPIYATPTDREQLFVRFLQGNGGKNIVKDIVEEDGKPQCVIETFLVPETTIAMVLVVEPKAEIAEINDEAQVLSSDVTPDFEMDIPEGAFENDTVISMKVFDVVEEMAEEDGEKENDEEKIEANTEELNEKTEPAESGEDDVHEPTSSLVTQDQGAEGYGNETPETKSLSDSFREKQDDADGMTEKTTDTEETTRKSKKRKRKRDVLLSDVYEINISGHQPKKSIKVQMPLNNQIASSDEIQMIRVDDLADGEDKAVTAEATIQNNNVVFETNHFCFWVAAPKPRCDKDMKKIYQTILNSKERKQKARFFAMICPIEDQDDSFVLIVECIRANSSSKRRKRLAERGFIKQKPKHSEKILLTPSQEFSISLDGDAQFDNRSGETGTRKLVFSPHRASYQPFQIRLVPRYKTGRAKVHVYAVNADNQNNEEKEEVTKLKIKLPLPPEEDPFGPDIEEAFTFRCSLGDGQTIPDTDVDSDPDSDNDSVYTESVVSFSRTELEFPKNLPARPTNRREEAKYTAPKSINYDIGI